MIDWTQHVGHVSCIFTSYDFDEVLETRALVGNDPVDECNGLSCIYPLADQTS